MDFNTKKFWVFQALVVIITICMFWGKVDFESWYQYVIGIEVAWGGLDSLAKFATKPKG